MLIEHGGIYVGAGDAPQHLLLKYANRHGLIAGATGTGKTVTLQGLVEGFSTAGVPVFIADVKGDLSGIAAAGADKADAVYSAFTQTDKNLSPVSAVDGVNETVFFTDELAASRLLDDE